MDYPKFKFTEEQKKEFLTEILEVATIHEIDNHEKVITANASDNIMKTDRFRIVLDTNVVFELTICSENVRLYFGVCNHTRQAEILC